MESSTAAEPERLEHGREYTTPALVRPCAASFSTTGGSGSTSASSLATAKAQRRRVQVPEHGHRREPRRGTGADRGLARATHAGRGSTAPATRAGRQRRSAGGRARRRRGRCMLDAHGLHVGQEDVAVRRGRRHRDEQLGSMPRYTDHGGARGAGQVSAETNARLDIMATLQKLEEGGGAAADNLGETPSITERLDT